MTLPRAARRLAAALATAALLAPAPAAADLAEDVRAALAEGRTAAAADLAARAAEADPADATARFALGTARFLGAVEGLVQDLHRLGLHGSGDPVLLGLTGLPFLRLPVPPNPDPEPVSYAALRATLARFADRLAAAEEPLAAVGRAPASLPLDLARIRLDLDGDGRGDADGDLLALFEAVAGPRLPADARTAFPVDFDESDAAWLRAYAHLLMALTDLLLAHDWEEAYAASFHGLFTGRFEPATPLSGRWRDLAARVAEAEASAPPPPVPPDCTALTDEECQRVWTLFLEAQTAYAGLDSVRVLETARMNVEYAAIADLLAFVHLFRWPVVEPARMASALAHLETVVGQSRETWTRALAETDDAREWIPAPRQSGVLPALPIDQHRLDAWLALLDELDLVLKGERLLPHWRFAEGLNLRRMFLEPRTLDPILLVQGSAAVPYLEQGEIADAATWAAIVDAFGGDFFWYAVWIN